MKIDEIIRETSIKGCILIVEDDPMNREFLAFLLGRYHDVIAVNDGEEALAIVQKQAIDVVLMDINLPVMHGFELLDTLRSQTATANIPVILLSAMATPEDIAYGLQRGANDYITKPVEAAVILARVNTQLKMKRLIDERQQAVDQLKTSEGIRRQFARIASHDLKNPLHNLRLAEHLLRDEIGNNPRMRSVLDMIDVTVDTMQRVIEDFLDMVELQTGEIILDPLPLAMRDVVINVLLQYEIAAAEKDITFKMKGLDGFVEADLSRMIQAVGNLVSNAVKYSPKGAQVTLWCEQHDGQLRLCVGDEGPGIPEDERSQLFAEFAKISTRPSGGEPSTGLGLWIVKHLMERQGGQAGANFPKEGGSIFWVSLPIYEASAEGIAS